VLETQVPEVAANDRQQADRSLELFDRQLAGRSFIAADRVTMADGVLFIGMEFARMVRFAVPEEFENLTRWQGALRERASAAADA
jgi:glutathione S-transferase